MANKLQSYPLLTNDPYFSYWSKTEKLNKSDVEHWTGVKKVITGDLIIDDIPYRFLGKGKTLINQVYKKITPLISEYHFENEQAKLIVKFWSPLFLDDPITLSRPSCYVDFEIISKKTLNKKPIIKISFDEAYVYDKKRISQINGDNILLNDISICYIGQRKQPLLESSGDNQRINWGYLFIALKNEDGRTYVLNDKRVSLVAEINSTKSTLVVAYDDVASLNYFGSIVRGYWHKKYNDIVEAIKDSFFDHDINMIKALNFDKDILKKARLSGGKELETIATASYRQTISGHKTSYDENGDLIFISKECSSNGCAATVDVTYPSIPLFLLLNPEFVFGMVRPIFKCARLKYWTFDFAPHDAGRYPHVTGNVYGINEDNEHNKAKENESYPPFYLYSENSNSLKLDMQMPVEECGNMLIILASAAKESKDYSLINQNMDLLTKWVKYLVEFGEDPSNQLCTDDFAGHLAHNTNLAIKAILGIQAYAEINKMIGKDDKYEEYHNIAKDYASRWEKRAKENNHTLLAFDKNNTWSIKYNLVWDNYFKSNLFSESLKNDEVNYYISKINKYGFPLDSRVTYTKSDWEVWASCLTNGISKRRAMLKPISNYISHSKSRIPFGDWYDIVNGKYLVFKARTVQGGCFLPILIDRNK